MKLDCSIEELSQLIEIIKDSPLVKESTTKLPSHTCNNKLIKFSQEEIPPHTFPLFNHQLSQDTYKEVQQEVPKED